MSASRWQLIVLRTLITGFKTVCREYHTSAGQYHIYIYIGYVSFYCAWKANFRGLLTEIHGPMKIGFDTNDRV